MSYWQGWELTRLQNFAVQVIKCGPIPNHVAFIMDGNRRFARKKGIQSDKGHQEGTKILKNLMYWCKEIGIREMTVYAFSIENFKRSQTEVDAIMDLSKTEFLKILAKLDKFLKDDIRVQFIGNLQLLPKEIRKLAAELTFWTQQCKTLTLNIAVSYTSRDEITNAVKTVVEGVRSGNLKTQDIDEDLLTRCMYTNLSKDPEILIRTSGETRFSDFLLWQTHQHTQVYVEDVMWPELTIWHILKILFLYQHTYNKNQTNDLKFESIQLSMKKEKFVKELKKSRYRTLQEYIQGEDHSAAGTSAVKVTC